jgi:hypothetical protein
MWRCCFGEKVQLTKTWKGEFGVVNLTTVLPQSGIRISSEPSFVQQSATHTDQRKTSSFIHADLNE